MARYTKEEIAKAKADIEYLAPKGSTIFTILRHRSASGMQRAITPICLVVGQESIPDIRDLQWPFAVVTGRTINSKHDGVTCNGCGMDMGFDLVYSAAQAVYGDGYALPHRWL